MKLLNRCFQNCKPFRSELVRDPNMTQNLHVCTICGRPEVVYDVISGRNVKTIEGYLVVNVEVTSSNSFHILKKNHFVTAAEAEARRRTNVDDSIKRKRIRVSHNKFIHQCSVFCKYSRPGLMYNYNFVTFAV